MSTSRRLRAVRLRTGGAALASVLLLGGCAAGTHPGAAATIGDQEISIGELEKSTTAIQSAVGGDQQVSPTAVLGLLVDNELAAQVVDQRAIKVTDAEIAPATKVIVDQTLYQKFVQDPVTNDFLRASARSLVARIKLAGGTGITDPNAQQFNSEGTKLLEDAAKKIPVDIAPRYGSWDGSKVAGTSGSLSTLSEQSKKAQAPDPQQQQQQPEQPPAEPQG